MGDVFVGRLGPTPQEILHAPHGRLHHDARVAVWVPTAHFGQRFVEELGEGSVP
jgi:hypothetical protein